MANNESICAKEGGPSKRLGKTILEGTSNISLCVLDSKY